MFKQADWVIRLSHWLKPVSAHQLTAVSVFLFLWVIIFPTTTTWGKERIRNLSVEIINQEIVVSAKLTGGFNREVIKDIQNGIPKDFYYYILLKRKDPNWFDEEILSKTILYRVKYDTLKKNYLVTEAIEEKVADKNVTDFEEMKEIISSVDRVRLAPVKVLRKRHHYYVSVKSQMQAAKRPFYLDYFLFFIPFLEIDTPWADSMQIVPTTEK